MHACVNGLFSVSPLCAIFFWFGVIRLVPIEVGRQMGKMPLLSVHKTQICWSLIRCHVRRRLGDNFFFSFFGRCSFCIWHTSSRTPPIVFGCAALNGMITEHFFREHKLKKKKKSNCEMVYGQSMSTYKKRVNSSNGDLKKILLYVVIYAVVCPLSDRFKLKTSLIISYVKSCVLSCTSIFTFHTYMRVWPVPAVRLYASPSRYTVCTYSVVHMAIYAAPEMCMSWLDKKEKKN